MSGGEWIGTVGVTILLLAYALNVLKKIGSDSAAYLFMNGLGALLACTSAFMINFWPFVVLEGVWAISSFIIFFRGVLK